MPPPFKTFPIFCQILLIVFQLKSQIKSKEGFLLIRKMDVRDDVPFDLFLRILHFWIQSVHIGTGIVIFIIGTISPPLPQGSNKVQIPKAGILYQKLIFPMPAGIPSDVMTQLEAQEQLYCLQRRIFEREIAGEESVAQLCPRSPLASRIDHCIVIVSEACAEVHHCRFYQLFQCLLLRVVFIENIECYLVDEKVADDLVSARVSLVNQIRPIVCPRLTSYEVFQNLRQITAAQIQSWMLFCCKIV